MKTEIEVIAKLIAATPNYPLTAEAIAETCTAVIEANPHMDIEFIDKYITDENRKRGVNLPDSVNYRNKLREVCNYIKALVFASMVERIEKTGEILIPDNGDNEGKPFFSEDIVEKYEIQAADHSYMFEYDFACIEVRPKGKLMDLFEKNDCGMMWFRVEFNAYDFEYTLQMDDVLEVRRLFRKIRVVGDSFPGLAEIEGLLTDIKINPNGNLVTHILKHST